MTQSWKLSSFIKRKRRNCVVHRGKTLKKDSDLKQTWSVKQFRIESDLKCWAIQISIRLSNLTKRLNNSALPLSPGAAAERNEEPEPLELRPPRSAGLVSHGICTVCSFSLVVKQYQSKSIFASNRSSSFLQPTIKSNFLHHINY